MDGKVLRQEVVRRARYALNTHALRNDSVPPEGVYDTALTNGLVAIVADEWPGDELQADGRMRPASALLKHIDQAGGSRWASVDIDLLSDALATTQPFRHGRADDDWEAIGHHHIVALVALDEHHALGVLERAAECRDYGDFVYGLFLDRAEEELPWDPKERSAVPDPGECDACWRPTFLRQGWDIFGGDNSEGMCVACGYERTPDQAYEVAVAERMREIANSDD